jgi:amidase
MPEWGFIPSTEFPDREPTRNPWNPGHTVGGSSGGAAALVAAGVVPLAHGVDGGGSIRIPAACASLVGLKPTLGRLRRQAEERNLPVSISVDGVLTRSVRDTARWYAEMERVRPPRSMPPMGEVTGPPTRRLRIALMGEIPDVAVLDEPTKATLEATAKLLEQLGHEVEPIALPVEPEQFRDDFVTYYRFLVFAATNTARFAHGRHYRKELLTKFSQGMARSFRAHPGQVIGASRRLRRTRARMAELHQRYDLLLSPTLATAPPELGELSPLVDFEPLLERVAAWMPYTPIANAAGTPAITMPMGFDERRGLPIGAMLSADFGNDALLLQAALELERAHPSPLSQLDA